jgi:hypothetical protein
MIKTATRSIAAWCLLSAAGILFARPIAAALSPMMERVIDAAQPAFAAHLSVVDSRDGPSIAMTCIANREIVFPQGRIVPIHGSFECGRVDALHALVPVVIFLVAVTAWPIAGRREAIGRTVASLVLLPCVVALTTPVLLLGRVQAALDPSSFRAGSQLTALLQPFVFMEMGGRWLLALVAGFLAIRFSSVTRRLTVIVS